MIPAFRNRIDVLPTELGLMRTYRETAHLELRELAEAILSSEVPRLEDLRRIAGLRFHTEHEDDPVFYFIRGMVSELDMVPDQSQRWLYSEKYLEENDAMCLETLGGAASDIRATCRDILSSDWLRKPTFLDVLESRLSDASGVSIPRNREADRYIKELADSVRDHSCEPFQVQARVEEPGFPDVAVGDIIDGWCVAKGVGYWLVYQPDQDRFCCFWGTDPDQLTAPGIFGSPLSCWFA